MQILHRGIAGVEEVLSVVSGHRPVVVLAGAVDALKWLFMQQAHQTMPESDLFHDLHRKLILVSAEVGGGEDGCHLVLCRCDLVVLGLGINAEFPQFFIELLHIGSDTGAEICEVLVVELLPLGGLCAKEGTSGQDEVLTLVPHLLIDEEVLLLGADGGGDTGHALIAKELQKRTATLERASMERRRGVFLSSTSPV